MEEEPKTQTQTSQVELEWSQSQGVPNSVPTIWGKLFSTKFNNIDLIQAEFLLGRALNCTLVVKKGMIKETVVKNVSKQHFIIKRDLSETLSPTIITDLSYNGTFINGTKIGKGNSRVLDDNDEISITHPIVKVFKFKDLLKNEQDEIPKEITQKYYISRVLGQGACGVVKLVYNKTTCSKYAMKIIKKNVLGQTLNTDALDGNLNNPQKIMNEIKIMKALKHPCVVSIEEVYDSRHAVYIVLELMRGGELFDRITKQGRLSEPLTRFFFRQMVLAVMYLHSEGITHRDLKPENVLLESKDDETLIKISDFGLSKFVGEDSFMKTMCGTPLYLAPEIFNSNGWKSYGPEVDVWSLGVIFFICLVGYQPFSPDYGPSLRAQVTRGRFRDSATHWRGVSADARHLVRRMLTVAPQRRITLPQILQHDWMQDKDVIVRVEKLLSIAELEKESNQLSISKEETTKSNEINIIRIIPSGKRPLSELSSSSLCEPVPKKLRVGSTEQMDSSSNTNDTTSVASG